MDNGVRPRPSVCTALPLNPRTRFCTYCIYGQTCHPHPAGVTWHIEPCQNRFHRAVQQLSQRPPGASELPSFRTCFPVATGRTRIIPRTALAPSPTLPRSSLSLSPKRAPKSCRRQWLIAAGMIRVAIPLQISDSGALQPAQRSQYEETSSGACPAPSGCESSTSFHDAMPRNASRRWGALSISPVCC